MLEIGFFSGDHSISDREIYYYSQLRNIKYKPFELKILKECAQVYVSGFYRYNDTIEMAPYTPTLSKKELSDQDDALIKRMLKG